MTGQIEGLSMENRDARCRECEYPLKGVPSGECPECGAEFDWSKRTTYKLGYEPGFFGTYVRPRLLRGAVLVAVIIVGLVLRAVTYNDFACCFYGTAFPIWLVACVVLILGLISVEGMLPLAAAMPIGVVAGVLLGLVGGVVGMAIGTAAGLIAAFVYKQMEMNNML